MELPIEQKFLNLLEELKELKNSKPEKGREVSIAITELETALLWYQKAEK